jgi:hypothetical protein
MVWHVGNVEKSSLQSCLMENPAKRGRKRKNDDNAEPAGAAGSNASSAVVAGAWLTPEKKSRTSLEVCNLNGVRGLGPMLITAEDLARILGANALMLVGDGEGFRVLERP